MPSDLTSVAERELAQIQHPTNTEPRDANVLANIFAQPTVNALAWLWGILQETAGSYFCPVGGPLPTVIGAINPTANVFTLAAHGLSNSDPVRLYTVSGDAPGGLDFETVYYVRDKTTDTFKLAATIGGAAIDITTAGAGDMWCAKIVTPQIYLPPSGDNPGGALAHYFDFSSQVTGESGSRLIGVEEITGGNIELAASTLFVALSALCTRAAKIDGANTFASGLQQIVGDLRIGAGAGKINVAGATGNIAVNGNKFVVDGATGATSINNSNIVLGAAGSGTFADSVEVGANLVVAGIAGMGSASVTGALGVGGAVTVAGAVTSAAKVQGVEVRATRDFFDHTTLTDADHNLSNGTNRRRLRMVKPTADRVLQVYKASAAVAPAQGDWFEVTVLVGDSAFKVTFQREGSSDYIVRTRTGGSGGDVATVRVEYGSDSEWHFTGGGGALQSGVDV